MIIRVKTYPKSFSIKTDQKFVPFSVQCDFRNELLHLEMERQQIASPYHDYTDYIVESVTKTKNGETWEIGS